MENALALLLHAGYQMQWVQTLSQHHLQHQQLQQQQQLLLPQHQQQLLWRVATQPGTMTLTVMSLTTNLNAIMTMGTAATE